MTAIAAVLAFSSTPLIAQTVTAPAEPAPAASAPVTTPVPVAPLTPTTAAPAVTDPLAPALPPMAETVTADKPEAASAPVKSKPVTKTSTTRTVKSPSVAGSPPVARPVTRPDISSASPESAKAAPAASTAVTTPIAAAPPATIAPTVAEAAPPQSTISTVQANEVLPIAGAAGAGLLALAGIGVAVRRRKRDEDEFIVEQGSVLETSHEQIVEPTFARAPIAASPAVTGPVDDDDFHDDFEVSKYGPNVQAAYRGPTADNPSLSLRKRLKRGAALDQMARNAGEAIPSAPRLSPTPTGSSDSFMLRPSSLQTSFRPVLQS